MKIVIEAKIEEDDVLTEMVNTNEFFNEITQLQQKYGVNSSIDITPFENCSFVDLRFELDGEYEFSSFASDLEDILEMHEVEFVYKNAFPQSIK